MCFSATASFTAGTLLGATGIATFRKAEKKERLLAIIPLLFGIQQLLDGVVWVSPATSFIHIIAGYAYGLLAFVFWPIFVPLATLPLETSRVRKKLLNALALIGAGTGSFFLFYLVVNGVTAEVVQNCVTYTSAHPYDIVSLTFYLIAVAGPFLVSSRRILNIFGAMLIISFGIAGWFYIETFSSVWCFFAAVLSAILYWHFYGPSR